MGSFITGVLFQKTDGLFKKAGENSGGGGGNIDELNVTPSTSTQTITASGGVDGYSPVKVAAVTSSIDANITAGNIKDGVEILGVTGDYKGEAPTGTMYIISNGTYNVADKAIANVQVPIPEYYIEKTLDANGVLIPVSNVIKLDGIKDFSAYSLYNMYINTNVSGNINFVSLEKVTGTSALNGTFENCTGITSVDFPMLTAVAGNSSVRGAFKGCTGITTVNMPKLVSVTNSNPMVDCFWGCTGLTSMAFLSLKALAGGYALETCFAAASNMSSLYFNALSYVGTAKTQFNNMLRGVTGCTVHFPSNMQSEIGSWSSVTGGFGGTNTTVLFDLPATVILTGANSINYERSPKDDTATALAWRVQDTGTLPNVTIDWTPYYTSGTTDPAVSDTIYSDAACTTAVTTISSVA